jgi:hypothetical protein
MIIRLTGVRGTHSQRAYRAAGRHAHPSNQVRAGTPSRIKSIFLHEVKEAAIRPGHFTHDWLVTKMLADLADA